VTWRSVREGRESHFPQPNTRASEADNDPGVIDASHRRVNAGEDVIRDQWRAWISLQRAFLHRFGAHGLGFGRLIYDVLRG